MTVSVVIATYNRAYILGEALESVFRQTYDEFEVIVVDDGSADDSCEVVKSFPERKVRYVRHQKNRGVSAAYNTGIELATGELVGILDSDDVWQPDYLKRQTDFLSKYPDVDAVFTDTEVRGGTRDVESLTSLMTRFPKLLTRCQSPGEYCLSRREMYLCLLEEVPIKPSALIVRRELYERFGGFDEAWPSGTDWDILLRFSREARFGYIHQPLVIQRRTSDATHELFREKDQLFLLDVFQREKACLQNDREALSAVNRAISTRCRNLGHDYARSGQLKNSFAIYRRGYEDTGDPALLLRAFSLCLPAPLKQLVKNALGVS
jgi:glycosyltransferase involved in cell wall biosynthesis